MTVPRLPVAAALPADWREQAEERERQDRDDETLAMQRQLASECPVLRSHGRHNLVRDAHPTFMCGEGGGIFFADHCDGRITRVASFGSFDLRCPVFEIDGDRWPPREGREPKARRKRIVGRTAP